MTSVEQKEWDGEKARQEKENQGNIIPPNSNVQKDKGPDDMPYFLTAHFKEIMDNSERDNHNQKEISEQPQEAVGMYKSEFLIKKVTLQNEKKKKERLAKAAN